MSLRIIRPDLAVPVVVKPGQTAVDAPPPPEPLREPTVAELAVNFTGAMGRWIKAGVPVVSAEAYAARSAICSPCEHWDGRARLGLGKCKAPGCGCTSLKRWLATESCPLGKWPATPVHQAV